MLVPLMLSAITESIHSTATSSSLPLVSCQVDNANQLPYALDPLNPKPGQSETLTVRGLHNNENFKFD